MVKEKSSSKILWKATSKSTEHYFQQSELPTELKIFKNELPYPFVQFEDARIEIKHFFIKYQFKPLQSYQNDYQLFLIQSLKSQAYKFLGSIDFLGNPLGTVFTAYFEWNL